MTGAQAQTPGRGWVRVGTLRDPAPVEDPASPVKIPRGEDPPVALHPGPTPVAAGDLPEPGGPEPVGVPPSPPERGAPADEADGRSLEEAAPKAPAAAEADPDPVGAREPDMAPPGAMSPIDQGAVDLEARLLERWRMERRRLRVVMAAVPPFDAQVLGAGRDVLYVADHEGRARLIYRWSIRELIPLDD
jgi:hypothetical protein